MPPASEGSNSKQRNHHTAPNVDLISDVSGVFTTENRIFVDVLCKKDGEQDDPYWLPLGEEKHAQIHTHTQLVVIAFRIHYWICGTVCMVCIPPPPPFPSHEKGKVGWLTSNI